MAQRIVQVDAFTSIPYKGNPAAVCVLAGPGDETWMRSVAAEMNLSETAFLYPEGSLFHLRWFTPAAEVDLCGHATLASAHVLFEEGIAAPDQTIRFMTKRGELTAARRNEWITLDFPATPAEETSPPPELGNALGTTPLYVGRSSFDYLVEVSSDEALRECAPDFGALARLPVRGIIITSQDSSGDYDFLSRGFFPAVGINEDPVTGSAHCTLAPFWAERLGQTEFLAYQASRRGGVLRVQLKGERVQIAGQAITTLRGELAH